MKKRFLVLTIMVALILVAMPVNVFGQDALNEKQYELPGYETYIKISNVVSDNSSDYITVYKFETDEGLQVRETAHDLYVEATSPCKVTYGQGDQYIHYAQKTENGSYITDYDRDLNFDVNKRVLFTYDQNTGIRVMGKTVDKAPDNSGMDTGAEGNYVVLKEGVYIVANYDPSLRHAAGQAFDDYDVILTVKGSTPAASTTDPNTAYSDTASTTTPTTVPANATAVLNTSTVLVDKTAKTFEAYNINGNNYFKLRDLAAVLDGTDKQFEVTWDGANNAIDLISHKKYTVVGGELEISANLKEQNAVLSTAKIYIDGQENPLTAYTIKGNNYFKLRDIAHAFNIGVTWDAGTSTIGIETTSGYTE